MRSLLADSITLARNGRGCPEGHNFPWHPRTRTEQGRTPPLVQIGTDFSQSTRKSLGSIRAWVSRAARLGPPTWSDERISLRPLPRIFVEAHFKSLKR